jgi:branched-chain amino acid transport system ATP-binding protein
MLEVKNLAVSYGRHRALEGVGVRVDKGEICVILGANGAGKSTLLKAIAGMVHAEPGGEVLMNGARITAMKPHRIVELGIALVPEGRGIFGDLTVAENLQLGAFAARARREEAATLDFIYGLFPRLAERRRQVARTMSGGEQQMVAIGRALMSKPEILMLDEPSLGLSPLLTQELFRSLKAIAATGLGILLVEQNAKQSLKIAGRGYLIENGAVTGENSAAALMSDPAVVNAYLGGTGARAARPTVKLPPPMRLPLDIVAIGGLIADLAARAGRIQAAFVRALRQGAELPSAFVGRYDPKAAGDPWALAEAEPVGSSSKFVTVSEEARRVGGLAETLARRATERLALHVRTNRLSAPVPPAFRTAQSQVPEPRSPAVAPISSAPQTDSGRAIAPSSLIGRNSDEGSLDGVVTVKVSATARDSITDLAARAAERSAAFVRARRLAAPQPAAFDRLRTKDRAQRAPSPKPEPAAVPPVAAQPARPVRRLNGSHGLIGHNSARFEIDPAEKPAKPAVAGGLSIAELAARAASVHAAHVAERRKTLTAFVIPAAPGYAGRADGDTGERKPKKPGKHHSRDSAKKKKKRKKHKEA